MADVHRYPVSQGDDEPVEDEQVTVVENPFSLRTNDLGKPLNTVLVIEDKERVNEIGTASHRSTGEETSEKDEGSESQLTGGQRFFRRFPRINAILVGIILPLAALGAACFFFGQGVLWAEQAHELNHNDAAMIQAVLAQELQSIFQSVMQNSLLVCMTLSMPIDTFQAALLNRTAEIETGTPLEYFFNDTANITIIQEALATAQSRDLQVVLQSRPTENRTILECSRFASSITIPMTKVVTYLQQLSVPDLTFHWNQCLNPGDIGDFPSEYHPDAQRDYYRRIWENSRDEVFQSIGEDSQVEGSAGVRYANLRKFLRSAMGASAAGVCEYNRVGASWFWFSVMSSIGYGDVVPQTGVGKIFVYTAGFASIIMFFGTFANAAKVLNTVIENVLDELEVESLRGWFSGVIFWFGMSFAWMFLIGIMFVQWNDSTLGVDLDTLDGFWFGYTSLVTLGFGDFVLPVDSLQIIDFITYVGLFLSGYLFLAAGFNHLIRWVEVDEEENPEDTLFARMEKMPFGGLVEDDEATSGDPNHEDGINVGDHERDAATLAASAAPTVRLDTTSVKTPAETIFTQDQPGNPFSMRPENVQ